MIINNRYDDPYNKFPTSEPIPLLSRPLVKSALTEKFWKITQNIFEATLKKDFDNLNNKKTKSNFNRQIKGNNINNEDINFTFKNNNNKNNKYLNMYKDDNFGDSDYEKENIKLNEENEKKKYIEKCKLLKLKNENFDKIIYKQEEENKKLIKRIEELEKILNSQMNINNNIKFKK